MTKSGEGRFFNEFISLEKPWTRMIVAALFLIIPMSGYAAEKEAFIFKKQTELQQIKPKKPVKIRLKRTSKDDYTWELSGDDVDEIVKTDRRLRQMLKVQ